MMSVSAMMTQARLAIVTVVVMSGSKTRQRSHDVPLMHVSLYKLESIELEYVLPPER